MLSWCHARQRYDIGADQGIFAYALADIADRVVAVDPNPDYAFFARWMLRGRAEVQRKIFDIWNDPERDIRAVRLFQARAMDDR